MPRTKHINLQSGKMDHEIDYFGGKKCCGNCKRYMPSTTEKWTGKCCDRPELAPCGAMDDACFLYQKLVKEKPETIERNTDKWKAKSKRLIKRIECPICHVKTNSMYKHCPACRSMISRAIDRGMEREEAEKYAEARRRAPRSYRLKK